MPSGLDVNDSDVQVGIDLFCGAASSRSPLVSVWAQLATRSLAWCRPGISGTFDKFGPAGLIHIIGHDSQGVQGVTTHAALDAAAHTMAQEPRHPLFLEQVLHALVDVRVPVDFLTRQVRRGRADFPHISGHGRNQRSA